MARAAVRLSFTSTTVSTRPLIGPYSTAKTPNSTVLLTIGNAGNKLDGAICIERRPSWPVVLAEWVLQQYDRVLFKDFMVQLCLSFSIEIDTLLRALLLEYQVM